MTGDLPDLPYYQLPFCISKILLYQTRLWVQIDRIGVPAWDIDGLVQATRYRTNTFVTTFSPVLTEQERVITKQSHCRL